MIRPKLTKQNISIQSIGKIRFWIGIAVGVFSAITIALFFNFTRELLRYFTGLNSDLLILDHLEVTIFNFFFSALSVTLGFSITVWFWMNGPRFDSHKQRLFKRLALLNSALIFWIVAMFVLRIGIVVFIVLSRRGNDYHLNLILCLWLGLFLLPVVVFLQNWNSIRHVFKINRWMLYSFIACMVMTIVLNQTTTISQDIINQNYTSRFQGDYDFINMEMDSAKNNYDLDFKPKTIEILKEWHSKRSHTQIKEIQNSFSKRGDVSLDTIILAKLIVRHFKLVDYIPNRKYPLDNWHYAFPLDILYQIKNNLQDEYKVKELVSLLDEQIKLINYIVEGVVIEIGANEYESETERRKNNSASYLIPKLLIKQLIVVEKEIKRIERISHLTKDMSSVKNELEQGLKH